MKNIKILAAAALLFAQERSHQLYAMDRDAQEERVIQMPTHPLTNHPVSTIAWEVKFYAKDLKLPEGFLKENIRNNPTSLQKGIELLKGYLKEKPETFLRLNTYLQLIKEHQEKLKEENKVGCHPMDGKMVPALHPMLVSFLSSLDIKNLVKAMAKDSPRGQLYREQLKGHTGAMGEIYRQGNVRYRVISNSIWISPSLPHICVNDNSNFKEAVEKIVEESKLVKTPIEISANMPQNLGFSIVRFLFWVGKNDLKELDFSFLANTKAMQENIVRCLKEKDVTEIRLRGRFYSEWSMILQNIADLIHQNKFLKVLSFSGCGMMCSRVHELVEVLTGASMVPNALSPRQVFLKEINLSNNNIGALGAHAVALLLINNNSLRKLILSSNNIGDAGASYIAEGLEKNKTLKILDLNNNNISKEGEFLKLLKIHKTLKIVFLANGMTWNETKNIIDENKTEKRRLLISNDSSKTIVGKEK